MQRIISKLRDLEGILLRLSDLDLPSEFSEARVLYDERLDQLERSHSHSWFGDHADTYFDNFATPPGGKSFDVEWGFVPGFDSRRNAGWRTYARSEVKDFALEDIGEGIFFAWHQLEQQLSAEYATARDQALDALEALGATISLKSLARYRERIENQLAPYSVAIYVNERLKATPRMSRDSKQIARGQIVPLYVQYMSSIRSAEANKRRARELAGTLRSAIEAASLHFPAKSEEGVVTRIFVGHGRSRQWYDLRDFIRDRLHLSFEEFNRVPVAGFTNKERLSEMLDQCNFAFLVMTGEDEHLDGSQHARENVIHEIGLFQGRLGWRRAVVLLEDGCQEFSNIAGVGQIRYERGKISTCFEEIRRVLEREGIISGNASSPIS